MLQSRGATVDFVSVLPLFLLLLLLLCLIVILCDLFALPVHFILHQLQGLSQRQAGKVFFPFVVCVSLHTDGIMSSIGQLTSTHYNTRNTYTDTVP